MDTRAPDQSGGRGTAEELRARWARGRTGRVVGSVLGVLLFGSAVWAAWGQRGAAARAIAEAGHASWYLLAGAVGLPMVGWSLTALMYFFLMNRDRFARSGVRCSLFEMHMVLGAAGLLNYAPARPGMFARIAYHTVVNKFPVKHVVGASVQAVAAGGVAVGLLAGLCVLAHGRGASGVISAVLLAVPVLALGVSAAAVRAALRTPRGEWAWRFLAGAAARYADCLTWLVRYVCVFTILKLELSLVQLAAITAISQAAALVPFGGAGLGVREWAIGLLGPMLPRGAGVLLVKEAGIAGDVINRGGELIAAGVVGVPCTVWVLRRLGRAGVLLGKSSAAATPARESLGASGRG